MKHIILSTLLGAILSTNAFAADDQGGLPKCRAELHDEVNTTVRKIHWREDLFIGAIEGASKPVLISTSLGHNKVISLWVREKVEGQHPYGMFSFVDLSTGREQSMRLYMADRFSVSVTCAWDPNK